ncbi:MAG: hypothetical protein VX936_13820 [Planctomycetota bacterium]|nr:hypothetical protein [Planctomycetota bacterium]
MSIRFACEHCQSTLNVADKFGGKRVKCPKCSQPIQVPAVDADELSLEGDDPVVPSSTSNAVGGWGGGARTHLDDLLDEAGVQAKVEGPTCQECGAAIDPEAIICVECGFNFQTGQQMATMMSKEAFEASGSESDKILRKAEKDLDENPVDADEGNFGDGPESFIIAAVAIFGGALLVAGIVALIFIFDRISGDDQTMQAYVTFGVCAAFYGIGRLWILISGFITKKSAGVVMLIPLVGDIWAIIFGFMRMRALWMPTGLCILGILGQIIGAIILAVSGDSGS